MLEKVSLFHYAYKLRISRIIGLKTMTDFHFVIVGTVKGKFQRGFLGNSQDND